MKKEDFLVLLNRYLSGDTTLEENNKLLNYYESFQTAQDWDDALGSKEEMELKMRTRLQNALQSEENKIIPLQPFYTKTTFKLMAMAASLLLLISISLFISKTNPLKIETPAVAHKEILIGSDKATLTLEDGSVIALEKGKSYTQGNASSNGEKLIYNSKDAKPAAIANNYLTIPRGGQFFVQLADSTKVWLNSESQLKYPVAFIDGETRQVELVYGEAYFEVSPSTKHKGSRFKVKTQSQNVEVIGTEFNIKAYKDETTIYTTLVKGIVAVSNASKKQILAPNEQSRITDYNGNIAVSDVDVYNEISWRKGLFVFKGMPLKDIARVLSRWYDADIVFADPALGNVKFNGVLNKNQKLEDILTTIKNINFINAYEKKDNKIIIK
ncbi:FecR family protein [Flavobacterium sp. S87F.05.LMB.W.Kidney.N]|uniref:FecR family protein n=1 Tax=Flavobacterium sp. S87F.05.LMB.W.Kidney.N TaxID=1278758 RepID=UPI001066E343|nr:FecR domain-containing protein [Flavobacterium sp. S87F.05.LMB.W.Kidney.N]TDX12380.1 FecR family protein [Flavobacterium sp. S87F.05.LMB.W.Kidney.N]